MTVRPFIIDTDLNFPSDDTQALLILCALVGDRLRGVSAAAGNTFAEEALVNIAALLNYLGRTDIALAEGALFERFLPRRASAIASHFRGDASFIGSHAKASEPRFSKSTAQYSSVLAQWDVFPSLGRLLAAQSEPVDLLCLGPLTNVADVLRNSPTLTSRIAEVWSMGGAANLSRVAPRFEFNVWYDPEAAHVLYNSGLPVRIFTRELSRRFRFRSSWLDNILADAGDGPSALLRHDIGNLAMQHGRDMPLCDQMVALAYAKPDIITSVGRGALSVDRTNGPLRGYSFDAPAHFPQIEFVEAIDQQLLESHLLNCCRQGPIGTHPPVAEFIDAPLYQIDMRKWPRSGARS